MNMLHNTCRLILLLACANGLLTDQRLVLSAAAGEAVEFSRDVQPILAEHCYHCHGPDASAREADLRLDQQAAVLGDQEGRSLVVAGEPAASELFLRISTADADLRMPPADTDDRLTAAQIETVRRWIEAGAPWQQHWAFVKPTPQKVPKVVQESSAKNEIDRFILHRLEQAALSPSPAADKTTLIRRVSLDLTGLPPTPAEVDAFLADERTDAYQHLVDRLLASPRYGEQMASVWLDAARYADTYGYQDDGETSMWRWRDWVIDAFNANMPFDQFTIEQLAGDLLPNPSLEQRIATGFNRNHRHNSEGGSIPEEFRTEYVIDRVETTGTVWLGLTLGCARCHDHKYDPISQTEFYQLFAFFNNVPEDGRARKEGNTPPLMVAPTKSQLADEAELTAQLRQARQQWESLQPAFLAALNQWSKTFKPTDLQPWNPVAHDLDLHLPLDGSLDLRLPKHAPVPQKQHAKFVPAPLGQAAELDGSQSLTLGDVGSFSSDDRVTLSLWVRSESANGAILSKIEYPDDPQEEGYTLMLKEGKLRVHLTSQWHDDAIRVQTETDLPLGKWTHLAVSYDGLSLAQGIQVYFDGVRQPIDVEFDSLYQGFGNDGSLRLGTAGDPQNQLVGAIDELRIYEEVLTHKEIQLLGVQQTIAQLLQLEPQERTAAQQAKLATFYCEQQEAARFAKAERRVLDLEQKLDELRRTYPTVMVMEEMPRPRPTHFLTRGQYDAPAQEVKAGIPSVFAGLPDEVPRNRLRLAQWLVDPENPLTARVIVNRLWQMSFDQGLVRTTEDFGIQGEAPTHPELLDWLALELIRSGWDLKAMRRLIVTSATYQQQSHVSPELLAHDPQNRLLARGPRFRLSAEAIRDHALFASGLLVEKLGGPSIRPYQPDGLWEELSDESYEQDHGKKLYRRSLYLFWKRTVTHPLMSAFDAPSREICSVREQRTNTPLQALTLMNEEGMVEAARVLAERTLAGNEGEQTQLVDMFRRVTARRPSEAEVALLSELLDKNRQHFQSHPEAAEQLVAVGEYPRNSELDPAEVASLSLIANLLLNSDEAVTQH